MAEHEQLTLFGDSEIIQDKKTKKDASYAEFVDKFKPKVTTDDCYTPQLVYDAVANWTAQEYGLDKSDFVRPFYPGGDYKRFDYDGKIVVDNPPFSILMEIIKFYISGCVRFLLFTPTLTGPVRYSDFCTVFPIGADIEYENGAVVPTSFCTNLDPHEIRARTVPALYEAVTNANNAVREQKCKQLPKYIYPMDVISSAQMYPFARFGIEYVIPRSESECISALDSQRRAGKSIFGNGWLLSSRMKAEREKAEREKATVWELSDRERKIIESLRGDKDD